MSTAVTLLSNSGRIDIDSKHYYTLVYRVDGNGVKLDPAAAINAVGTKPGTQYVSSTGTIDVNAYCLNVTAEPWAGSHDGGQQHRVTCDFGPYNPNLINDNPLDIYPYATWDKVTFTRPIDIDVDGNPILNTAYDNFEPTIETEDFRPIATIHRNEASVDPYFLMSFKNTVNINEFFGWPAGAVLCSDVRWNNDFSNTVGLFYRVEYDFQFTFDEWGFKKKVMSAGYRELYTNGSGKLDRKPILIQGQAATSPVPLDANGHKVDIGVSNWQANVFWHEFKVYNDMDFNVLAFANVIGMS